MQRFLQIHITLALLAASASLSYSQEHRLTNNPNVHNVVPDRLIRRITIKGTSPLAGEKKFVKFVYIVPADSVVKPEYELAIENAARHLQGWYKDQLGDSKSFNLHEDVVQVYQSSHESNWFSQNPEGDNTFDQWRFWSNVALDGFQLTGGANDPNNFYIFYIDALPACPMLQGGATVNVSVVGANDLRGLVGKSWLPICDEIVPDYSSCRYVGGIGHELGHVFGLPHPPGCDDGQPVNCDSQSIMFLGYLTYPDCHFSENEKATLRASPFISDVVSTSCTIDCGDLARNYNYTKSVDVSICDGASYYAGGKLQTLPGTYYDTFVSQQGCDSLVITRLELRPSYKITKDVSICQGKTYFAGGKSQTEAGTYQDVFKTKKGCDSIIVTQLKVLPVFNITKDVTICKGGSYFAGGKLQSVAGMYKDAFKTKSGCDSVIVTNLKVLPVYNITKDVSICKGGSYFAGGKLQSVAGMYKDAFKTKSGCDSVIVTNLKVLPVYNITQDVSICKGGSYFAGGKLQAVAGTYKDTFKTKKGCDSLITTRLKILSVYETTKDVSICKGQQYFAGGKFQTTAGVYKDIFNTSKGCDSTIVTHLDVLPEYKIKKEVSICKGESYLAGGSLQKTPGTYHDAFITSGGCDSLVTTKLTVLLSYETIIDAVICQGETYLAGGNEQTEEGTYMDRFVSNSGCDSLVVTKLTVGICTAVESDASLNIKVYPVPTTGILHIESVPFHHVEVFNSLGQAAYRSNSPAVDFTDLPEGYYYVKIFYDGRQFITRKVVLKR